MKNHPHSILVYLFVFAALLQSANAMAQDDAPARDSTDSIIKPASKSPDDLIELGIRVFHIDTSHKFRSEKKIQFALLPTAAAVPGGGAAIVTTLNAAFYLGDRATTNLSTADLTPVITTSGKFILSLRSTLWLNNNRATLMNETRYMKYPDYTWGIGGNTNEDNRSILKFEYLRFYQSVLRKIFGHTSAGVGYRIDHYYNIEEQLEDSSKTPNTANYPYGTDGNSLSSGFTLQVLYDSRKNSINPENGKYLSVVYRNNLTAMASDYNWQSIYADGRLYVPLQANPWKLIAFRTYYWDVLAGNVPYLDLPANGWDFAASARGLRRGRYRSTQMMFGESELRFNISDNGFWGGVVFANCLAVSDLDKHNLSYFYPAAGCGVRVKFNKYSRSNIAMDIGFSKNFFGFYLNLGEAF